MFLHAGASLHGHEYSAPPPPQNRGAIRIPYLRSALRQMTDTEANAGRPAMPSSSTHHHHIHTHNPSWSESSTTTAAAESYDTPTRPPRPLSYAATTPLTSAPSDVRHHSRPRPKSDFFPRKEHAVRFAEPTSGPEDEPPPRRATMTAAATTTPTTPAINSPTSERTLTNTLQSEDDSAYSELSDANTASSVAGRRRRRRTARSGARYLVAQPPPRVVRRHRRFINLRPSLMLQLQQLTDTRPRPAFDILPSSVLRGSLTGAPRLARRFPRLLGGFRSELHSDDLIIATSEDYDDCEGSDDSDDELGKRELLAVVSPAGATTDIVLADGTIWTAQRLANGSFEFAQATTDGDTVTARWVKRRVAMEDGDNYKFTFSVLDPGSRRHPIMATLTASTLEVLDNYTTVSPSCSGKHPPTRPFSYDVSSGGAPGASPVSVSTAAAHKGLAERTTQPVDEATKMFITVSAMWISLQLLGMVPELKVPAAAAAASAVPQAAALPSPTCPHSILKTPSFPATPAPPMHNAPSLGSAPAGSSRDGQLPPLNSGGDLRRALSSGAAAFVTRRKSVSKKRGESSVDMGAESAGEQGHRKRRLYTRIKKALGLRRDEMER